MCWRPAATSMTFRPLAQYVVHTGLPAGAHRFEFLQYLRINPQCDVGLRSAAKWPSWATTKQRFNLSPFFMREWNSIGIAHRCRSNRSIFSIRGSSQFLFEPYINRNPVGLLAEGRQCAEHCLYQQTPRNADAVRSEPMRPCAVPYNLDAGQATSLLDPTQPTPQRQVILRAWLHWQYVSQCQM